VILLYCGDKAAYLLLCIYYGLWFLGEVVFLFLFFYQHEFFGVGVQLLLASMAIFSKLSKAINFDFVSHDFPITAIVH